ncbi:MAG: hypothetical protein IKC03_01530 [Oscillospiraceae bacterium]|nr:hypothetical protein [Oscillospiraceae bacterium]
MKKRMNKLTQKFSSTYQRVLEFINHLILVALRFLVYAGEQTKQLLCDCKGDLATNTIGAIIIAVVIIGLLVIAINAFFPNFFTTMFNSMQTKLNANW